MGIFIAIEGTDGAGKGTQTALLKERLEGLGRRVLIVDFPRYGTPEGAEIRKWLDGKLEWTPLEAADRYAADRKNASPEMHEVLGEGGVVIANRYLTSNIAHQGARLKDPVERKELYDYVFRKEYGENGIPKPDLTLVLHVTVGVSQANVDRRGTRDRLEADPTHLASAEEIYLALPEIVPTPVTVLECMGPDGTQLSKEAIHGLIWGEVEALLEGAGPV
jgi:thymidylate kinase